MSALSPQVLAARLDVVLSMMSTEDERRDAWLAWSKAEDINVSQAERLLLEAVAAVLPADDAFRLVLLAAFDHSKALKNARAGVEKSRLRLWIPADAPAVSPRKL